MGFNKTRGDLHSKKLPDKIIQRHDNFVKKYKTNLRSILNNLNQIEKAKKGVLKEKVKAAKDHMKKNIYKKKHIPLDPKKLPHRRSNLKPRKPVTDPKKFEKLFKDTTSNKIHQQQASIR